MREGLYAPSYMVLAPFVGKKLEPHLEKPWMRSIAGAIISGAFVGCLSTPFDVLRAAKQDHLCERQVAHTYSQIFSDLGVKGLFRGMTHRSLACIMAIYLMNEGRSGLARRKTDCE